MSSNVIRGAQVPARAVSLPALETPEMDAFAPFPAGPSRRPAPGRQAQEERLREAVREAREAGLAEGRAGAEAELEGLRSTLEMVVRELWAQREQLYRDVEEDAVRLALEVARRVVGRIAERERELVEHLATEALRRVSARDRVTLRVNPEDLELVRARREQWLALVEGVEHFEVVEDRRVPRGGALVTTRDGSVDARWTTQLVEIERALSPQEPGA